MLHLARIVLPILLLSSIPAIAQIPSNATSTGNLDGGNSYGNWEWNHDPGTPGTSTGYSSYPVTTPSLDNLAREFDVAYADYGGELYHLLFGNDTSSTYFVYDTWVYLTDPAQVQNLELDVNQVLASGETVIFSTQCSSISGTWEYSYVANGGTHWAASNIACNPQSWAPNRWHHVQIQVHRDASGAGDVVTHDWVKLDSSKAKDFKNAVAASGLFLNWGVGSLVVNFQVDGALATSGTITGYFDELQIWRW